MCFKHAVFGLKIKSSSKTAYKNPALSHICFRGKERGRGNKSFYTMQRFRYFGLTLQQLGTGICSSLPHTCYGSPCQTV